MRHPVEASAVHNRPAECGAVAVHVFCGRVGDDICTPFKRAAVDRCGEGIIDHKRNAMSVSHLCEQLDIKHGERRVGDGLTKHQLCVWTEGCV